MGRKKALVANQAQESFELKPFCYYCEREFDSSKTLIQHQRTKHFNCAECGLKFDTVTGLRVHMLNAYKKTMKEVPNSIPGRENPDIVVHGMEGLPKGIIEEKTRKASAERAEREKAKEEEARQERERAPAARQERERERERASQVSSATSAAVERSSEAPPPPAASTQAPPSPASAPQPTTNTNTTAPAATTTPAPTPTPMPARPAPPAATQASTGRERGQAQAEVPAASQLPQAMMPGLSPAVVKLLSGDASSAPTASGGMTTLSSLPGYLVPAALAGLHPVALQVLAAAGALAPEKVPPAFSAAPLRPAAFPGPAAAPAPGAVLPTAPALPSPGPGPGPGPAPLTGAGLAPPHPAPAGAGAWALGGPGGLGSPVSMPGAVGVGPVGIVGSLAPPLPGLGEPDEKRLRLAPPV